MPKIESSLPRPASLTCATSLAKLLGVQERGDRHGFLGLLVDHHRHADAAVRVAAAAQLSPIGLSAPCTRSAQSEKVLMKEMREPVARRLAEARLVLHVVRQVRQRVALRCAALVGDFLVAAGEGDRLEREEGDRLRVVERELDDAADLLVVDAVDDRDDRHDVDAVRVAGSRSRAASRRTGCRPCGASWRRCRCRRTAGTRSAGRLRRPGGRTPGSWRTRCRWWPPARCCSRPCARSAPRRGSRAKSSARRPRTAPTSAACGLMRDGVVEQRLDVFPGQLVDEPDLVGVHEARIAHHVAAVGQVDGEHRAAAVRDGAGAVVVQRARRCARGCRGRGRLSSRCLKNAVSIAITSSKWPWMGQSFTIRILPSRSMTCALISPTFSFMRMSTGFLPSRIFLRVSGTHLGQSESVSRGQPSGGFVFSYDFSSGLSDHFGVNDGFGAIRLSLSNTSQATLAAEVNTFSTYLMGLCISPHTTLRDTSSHINCVD